MKTKVYSLPVVLALIAGVYPALTQPTLSIAPAGNQIVLFWPWSLTNYVLESTTNLASPNWVTATDAVPVSAFTVTNTSHARFFRLSAVPGGMVLIPAGSFMMGNSIGDPDSGVGDAPNPPISVTVSAFYMDVNLVSYSQWQSVYFWATNYGYNFSSAIAGKAANHPVHQLNWYDAVKWCNARSQQAGLTPVYYTDAGLTQVFISGDHPTTVYPNWTASGYRLPTEAEWEKAARGGLSGQRFPWGNIISHNLANYIGTDPLYSYDLGPSGHNPAFGNGNQPYTSPVGSFAPNGYGLYDMAGNVFQWCWDRYGALVGGIDPRGPASGNLRIKRGGSWDDYAYAARCAYRIDAFYPYQAFNDFGFRCVRGL